MVNQSPDQAPVVKMTCFFGAGHPDIINDRTSTKTNNENISTEAKGIPKRFFILTSTFATLIANH